MIFHYKASEGVIYCIMCRITRLKCDGKLTLTVFSGLVLLPEFNFLLFLSWFTRTDEKKDR